MFTDNPSGGEKGAGWVLEGFKWVSIAHCRGGKDMHTLQVFGAGVCIGKKEGGWPGDEHQTKIKLSLHLHLHWQSSKLAGQFAVLKFCTLRGNATGCVFCTFVF